MFHSVRDFHFDDHSKLFIHDSPYTRMNIHPQGKNLKIGETVDIHGNSTEVITKGRHDPCVGIRATPIAEAMMALVLMDHVLRHRAQNAGVQHSVPVIPSSA